MVFNESVLIKEVIVFLLIWNVCLSIFIFRVWRHYNKLTQGSTNRNLRDVLESILNGFGKLNKKVDEIDENLHIVQDDGKLHVQRVGILRFNPFSDTGGNQSFTIAILDGKANGIVMTSLYARTGNRWYVKEIHEGRGKDIELSKEELTVIGKASIQNK